MSAARIGEALKKLLVVLSFVVLFALAVPAMAQERSLTGAVLDNNDRPVPHAVVYLKNTKTQAIKTFIAEQDGTYRFQSLSPNIDYEVYAQLNGRKSDSKTLSSFDSKSKAKINLRIDTK